MTPEERAAEEARLAQMAAGIKLKEDGIRRMQRELQGFEIFGNSNTPQNSLHFVIFHSFLSKYSDLAPKSGLNETQLVMLSSKCHRF